MIFCYWMFNDKPTAECERSIETVRRLYPAARIMVYGVGPVRGATEVVKLPVLKTLPNMVANIHAQLDCLMTVERQEHVWFLDTDILLVDYLPEIMADLVVTYRDHVGVVDGQKVEGIAAKMPYNYGVLGATVNKRSIAAFTALRDRCAKMSPDLQKWYGNQMALRDVVGPPGDATVTRSLPYGFFECDILPGDQFNYTPESEDESLEGKHVLHLKGDRKHMMDPLAERILCS